VKSSGAGFAQRRESAGGEGVMRCGCCTCEQASIVDQEFSPPFHCIQSVAAPTSVRYGRLFTACVRRARGVRTDSGVRAAFWTGVGRHAARCSFRRSSVSVRMESSESNRDSPIAGEVGKGRTRSRRFKYCANGMRRARSAAAIFFSLWMISPNGDSPAPLTGDSSTVASVCWASRLSRKRSRNWPL
jgi:hypothetical protein